jgi:hypothetical protein
VAFTLLAGATAAALLLAHYAGFSGWPDLINGGSTNAGSAALVREAPEEDTGSGANFLSLGPGGLPFESAGAVTLPLPGTSPAGPGVFVVNPPGGDDDGTGEGPNDGGGGGNQGGTTTGPGDSGPGAPLGPGAPGGPPPGPPGGAGGGEPPPPPGTTPGGSEPPPPPTKPDDDDGEDGDDGGCGKSAQSASFDDESADSDVSIAAAELDEPATEPPVEDPKAVEPPPPAPVEHPKAVELPAEPVEPVVPAEAAPVDSDELPDQPAY